MSGLAGAAGARVAVIATHPIQYAAPWFSYLQSQGELALKVFYLSDFGLEPYEDPGFNVPVRWDVPLLDGYESEFVPNRSPEPGTGHFLGLWNPALVARVRAFRPDALLLTAYNYASIAGLLARWGADDAPMLFRGDSHRLVSHTGPLAEAKRFVLSRIFRRFSAFLFVGAANREYFRLHGVSDERMFHSPHAVDNERFFRASQTAEVEAREWRASLGIPAARRVVLFAGKFEEKKRPMDLLAAFRAARLENTALLFTGSGPLEPQLRAAAENLPDVFFAPFQNQMAMPRTYAAGDVLVLPSFGASETWGLAVNEAMCMGRAAIVSTHVGCAADLVVPRLTGLTFEAGNVSALRDALREAMADPERLRTWGANARRHIESYDYHHASAGLRSALEFSLHARSTGGVLR